MIFAREYDENLNVCPQCNHHGRIGPKARFEQIFDETYTELPTPRVAEDPLKFRDTKKYTDRIKAARTATGTTPIVRTKAAAAANRVSGTDPDRIAHCLM